MGQRSQIYIKVNLKDQYGEESHQLFGFYYGWNYSERMVSRARAICEWLQENAHYMDYHEQKQKLETIARTNFDMKDAIITGDIIKGEFEDNDYRLPDNNSIFNKQDNNNGQCFIEVDCDRQTKETQVYYCFRDMGDKIPMDAEQYILWDNKHHLDNDKENEGDYKNLTEKLYENLPKLLGVKDRDEYKDTILPLIDNIEYIQENYKIMSPERLKLFLNADYSKQFREMQGDVILDKLAMWEKVERKDPKDWNVKNAEQMREIYKSYLDGSLNKDEREQDEIEEER